MKTMGKEKLFFRSDNKLQLNEELSVIVDQELCKTFAKDWQQFNADLLMGKKSENPKLEYKIVVNGVEHEVKFKVADESNSADEVIDEIKSKLTNNSENLIITPESDYIVYPISCDDDNITFFFTKM